MLSTTREASGLGLGLSIAKQLVELRGGTIAASSAGAWLGSTFSVRVPVERGAHAASPADAGNKA